jgi:long-chain acyl-CoA synthetase
MRTIPRNFTDFLALLSDYGDTTALCDAQGERQYTYAQFVDASHNLASRFSISPGDRVLLYRLNQIDWVLLFFAIQIRGGIAVPVDERTSEDFLQKVIAQTNPVCIVTDESEYVAKNFSSVELRTITQILDTNQHQCSKVISDNNAPCQIIYTSGTWSDPKGVVLSQRNILSNVEQILSAYPHTENDVVLGILPLTHTYQQTLGLFTPLALGSQVVFLRVTSSIELLQTIKKYKVTLIPLVPRVLELLYSAITRKITNKRLRSLFVHTVKAIRFLPRRVRRMLFFFIHKEIGKDLQIMVSGGSPLRREIDQFFEGLGYRLPVGYGLSECAPIVGAHFGQRRSEGEVGRPLPGIDVTLDGNQEIIVKGENVFLGYWPDVQGQEYVKTGDIGEFKSNGSLILKGRNKNLIIFDTGEKCFCEDMETIISSIPEVDSCCVIEKQKNNQVTAQCVFSVVGDAGLDEQYVINFVNKRTPLGVSLKKAVLITVADFPVTHTMKPKRGQISEFLDSYESNPKTDASC